MFRHDIRQEKQRKGNWTVCVHRSLELTSWICQPLYFSLLTNKLDNSTNNPGPSPPKPCPALATLTTRSLFHVSASPPLHDLGLCRCRSTVGWYFISEYIEDVLVLPAMNNHLETLDGMPKLAYTWCCRHIVFWLIMRLFSLFHFSCPKFRYRQGRRNASTHRHSRSLRGGPIGLVTATSSLESEDRDRCRWLVAVEHVLPPR